MNPDEYRNVFITDDLGEYAVDGFTIEIPSDAKYAKVVRGAVGYACELSGFSPETGQAVTLAVDEAVTNIIRHAYRGEAGHAIRVSCRITPRRLEILLQDSGQGADPGTMKSRDLDQIRPGGLGLHFIKSIMDVVDYQSGDAGNQLLLAKNLPGSREPDAQD